MIKKYLLDTELNNLINSTKMKRILKDFKEFFIRKIDNENYYVNCGAWWVITPDPPKLIPHIVKYTIYNFWWLILLLIFIGFTLQ